MARWVPTLGGTTLLLLAAVQASHGQAQGGGADFYKGKTIRIVISTGVAGGYARICAVLAEHIGRHIAGGPHVIVQSMPGAGGLPPPIFSIRMAPQDGTTIGIVHSTVRSRRCGAARACASTR